MQHIEQIEQRIARMDQYLLEGLRAWPPQLNLLQTIPDVDIQGAAMLLVEIGADMTVFGCAERGQKRPALDQDAAQTWLRRRNRCRLIRQLFAASCVPPGVRPGIAALGARCLPH